MTFRDSGQWIFESKNSAVLSFETTERKKTRLVWGPTTTYGNVMLDTTRHYIHIFHVTGLTANTTYHARVTALADDGSTALAATGDIAFTTKPLASAILIPAMVAGPPFVLDQDSAYYLVTEDITAPGTAFKVGGTKNVTLDLGGHTVVYDNVKIGLRGRGWYDVRNAGEGFGVWGYPNLVDGSNFKLYNGIIKQGAGNDSAAQMGCMGFNPVYLAGAPGCEVAGMHLIYSGPQVAGLILHWSGYNRITHHNIFEDRGTLIYDREQLVAGIKAPANVGCKYYNNLVKRTRQCGFTTGPYDDGSGTYANNEVFNNEIHVTGFGVNAFGMYVQTNIHAYGNRIFGCGNQSIGIAASHGKNAKIYNNYIWSQAHDQTELIPYFYTWPADGFYVNDVTKARGIRVTWGCDSVDFYDNTILVTGREGGIIEGTWLYSQLGNNELTVRNNLLIAIVEDDATTCYGAIGGTGDGVVAAPFIVFEGNTAVSNSANFNMRDDYGKATNYRFLGNHFVKVGNRSDYYTIGKKVSGYTTRGHILINSTFEGGASYLSFYNLEDRRPSLGQDNFMVAWTLHMGAPATASLTVKDVTNAIVYTGTGSGVASLYQYLQTATGGAGVPVETLYTPHTVVCSYAGHADTTVTITMDTIKSLSFFGEAPPVKVENPSNGNAAGHSIAFQIAGQGNVLLSDVQGLTRVDIYDITGRKVQSLGAGSNSLRWSGKDCGNRSVGAGVYFVRFVGSQKSQCKRVVLSR